MHTRITFIRQNYGSFIVSEYLVVLYSVFGIMWMLSALRSFLILAKLFDQIRYVQTLKNEVMKSQSPRACCLRTRRKNEFTQLIKILMIDVTMYV